MTLRFGLLLLTVGCAACFSDPPAPQRVPSQSGGSTGDVPDTDSGVPEGSSGEDLPQATTSGSSSSGDPWLGCGEADDAKSCAAASDPASEACSWYPTHSHDALNCDPWATGEGACVIEQGLDGCSEPEATCSNGASWYYRVDDGLVELVDATNLCYGLTEFTPCPRPGDEPAETEGTTIGSGSSGGAESGASGTSVGDSGASADDGGDSGAESTTGVGGTTGDGWTLQDEIEAVCACACET